MSYLSELLARRITGQEALAKSIGYLKRKAGLGVTDAEVDAAVFEAQAAAQHLAEGLQKQLAVYIAAHAPLLPADIIAEAATTAALNAVDIAIAGAGNVVKAHN